MPPVLLDARQLAETLSATYEEVLSWARRGQIPSIRVSGRRYFNLREVAKALHSKREPASKIAG